MFDPDEWPPSPGEVAAVGPRRPARHTLLVAHGHWRRARFAALLPEDTAEYRRERLLGLREAVALTRGIQPEEEKS